MPRRVVEILFFPGCPGFDELLPRVRELTEGRAELALREISSVEQARRERFLGSPSVRVDGRDVEPGAGERLDFGMKCRLYRTSRGQAHAPSDAWIRDALAGR